LRWKWPSIGAIGKLSIKLARHVSGSLWLPSFTGSQISNAHTATAWGLLILVALLNAARNSISFFMLLIVCMGYGVVK
jgi:hypothetical protein